MYCNWKIHVLRKSTINMVKICFPCREIGDKDVLLAVTISLTPSGDFSRSYENAMNQFTKFIKKKKEFRKKECPTVEESYGIYRKLSLSKSINQQKSIFIQLP